MWFQITIPVKTDVNTTLFSLFTAYLFALVFSISVANIDDRISLYKEHEHLW